VTFTFKIMLENRNEANCSILKKHLDYNGLFKTLEELMKDFIKKENIKHLDDDDQFFLYKLENRHFKTSLGDAINIYILFRYIWDDPIEFQENIRKLIEENYPKDSDEQEFMEKIIFKIFKRLVGSIEIVDESKDPALLRIWFPILAVCQHFHSDTKNSFINTVDRSNSQTKISGLLDACGEFIPQMYTDYNAKDRFLGLNLKSVYYVVRFLSNLLAIVINIYNFVTFEYDQET